MALNSTMKHQEDAFITQVKGLIDASLALCVLDRAGSTTTAARKQVRVLTVLKLENLLQASFNLFKISFSGKLIEVETSA